MPVIDLTPEEYQAVVFAVEADLDTIMEGVEEITHTRRTPKQKKILNILEKDRQTILSVLNKLEYKEAEPGEAVKPNKVVDGDMQC
jgi:hypothetical protein